MTRRTALLATLTPLQAKSGDESASLTQGLPNGVYWLSSSPHTKQAMIYAVTGALVYINAIITGSLNRPLSDNLCNKINFEMTTNNYTVHDVVRKIDKIYDDPRNLIIPFESVFTAAMITLNSARDTTKEQESLAASRKTFAK
jgi:hypothetical protein